MTTYQKAKPFDFVRDFKDLQTNVQKLQVLSPGQNTQWADASGSLPAGFTVSTVCRWKYFATDNCVHFQFALSVDASASTSPTVIFVLEEPYIPEEQYDGCAPRIFVASGGYETSISSVGFRVDTSGNVSILDWPGTTVNLVAGYYVIPLD